jgi:hypothetical protein
MKFVYRFIPIGEREGSVLPGFEEPNAALHFSIPEKNCVQIAGNQAGLLYLAKLLIRLAQPGIDYNDHLHLDVDSDIDLTRKSKCDAIIARWDEFKSWPDEEDHLHQPTTPTEYSREG